MTLQLLKEKETPLLARRRLTVLATFEKATPSRAELRKTIAALAKADEQFVLIKHIFTKFGNPQAKVICHIYQNEQDMRKLEPAYMLKKHGFEVAEKKKKEAKKAKEATVKAAK